MTEFLAGIALFTSLIVLLSVLILLVRAGLLKSETVVIKVNDGVGLKTASGDKLLAILARANMHLPAVCGGRGTCGQCRVVVNAGGGMPLPTETALLSRADISAHQRLACQLTVRENLEIRLPEEVFGIRQWVGTVASCQSVATFIRELVIDLPEEERIDFKAGSYVMVECPAYQLDFRDLEVPDDVGEEWTRYDVRQYSIDNHQPVTRAYSLANHPLDNRRIVLNIRLALPPPKAQGSAPPGVVSSYLFSLKPGDAVAFTGPYGHFYARDTENEMIFVGGGAGMAPLRSHILHQLLNLGSTRKISFWYGARSLKDLFYQEEFEALQERYENFSWHVALSEPREEDHWSGQTGLIHHVLLQNYLESHPYPEDCEYYLCGPPMMNLAVIKMLEDLGVSKTNIMLDEFKS